MRAVSVSVILFLFLCIVGCEQHPAFSLQIDETVLQEGDIAFRRGMSIASRMVLVAEKESGYSHIGIIAKDFDEWKVIHAVPGETDKTNPEEIIKKESLAEFFAPTKSVAGAIYRLDTVEKIGRTAAQKAKELFERKLLFDHKYDLEDSTKMYCTELIWFSYKCAGVDISEGRRNSYPALNSAFILPSDILVHSKLKLIYPPYRKN